MNFKHLHSFVAAVLCAVGAVVTTPANAGFIGATVHVERWNGSTLISTHDLTVDNGVELNAGFFRLDITENSLKFIFPVASFGSLQLAIEGLQDVDDPSAGLEILSITPYLVRNGWSGPYLTADDIAARLTLDGNDLLFDMSGFVTGSTSTLEIVLGPAAPAVSVSEPATLALIGGVLPAFALARCVRRRRA